MSQRPRHSRLPSNTLVTQTTPEHFPCHAENFNWRRWKKRIMEPRSCAENVSCASSPVALNRRRLAPFSSLSSGGWFAPDPTLSRRSNSASTAVPEEATPLTLGKLSPWGACEAAGWTGGVGCMIPIAQARVLFLPPLRPFPCFKGVPLLRRVHFATQLRAPLLFGLLLSRLLGSRRRNRFFKLHQSHGRHIQCAKELQHRVKAKPTNGARGGEGAGLLLVFALIPHLLRSLLLCMRMP